MGALASTGWHNGRPAHGPRCEGRDHLRRIRRRGARSHARPPDDIVAQPYGRLEVRLSDGRYLISAANAPGPAYGRPVLRREAFLYDPIVDRWSVGDSLRIPRALPTALVLR